MATVTGYTAAKMEQMRKANVINARLEVVAEQRQLVLIPDGFDEEPLVYPEINIGDVRGPIGSPGVTEPELDAFLAAYELKATPVGAITDYIGTAAPTNWLGMTGQAIVDGQTLYPALWAILPASMKVGSTISMPDTRGRVTVGLNTADAFFDTIGKIGGSKDAVVVTHSHTIAHQHTIAHTHSIAHDHAAFNTAAGGSHVHTRTSGSYIGGTGFPGGASFGGSGTPGLEQMTTVQSNSSDHVHSIDVPAFAGNSGGVSNDWSGGSNTPNSGDTGETGANKNLQPYITFMKIIRAL